MLFLPLFSCPSSTSPSPSVPQGGPRGTGTGLLVARPESKALGETKRFGFSTLLPTLTIHLDKVQLKTNIMLQLKHVTTLTVLQLVRCSQISVICSLDPTPLAPILLLHTKKSHMPLKTASKQGQKLCDLQWCFSDKEL